MQGKERYEEEAREAQGPAADHGREGVKEADPELFDQFRTRVGPGSGAGVWVRITKHFAGESEASPTGVVDDQGGAGDGSPPALRPLPPQWGSTTAAV